MDQSRKGDLQARQLILGILDIQETLGVAADFRPREQNDELDWIPRLQPAGLEFRPLDTAQNGDGAARRGIRGGSRREGLQEQGSWARR